MALIDILNKENINIKQLEKGLKVIGLNLSRFDGVPEERIPVLIGLFKTALDLDPVTTTKLIKMDIRSKLEKVLRNTVVSSKEFVNVQQPSRTQKPQSSNKGLDALKTRSALSAHRYANKKLGKVKFFDSTKGFGYIHSFSDKKDCYTNASYLLTTPINEDDIVIFETNNSIKKPGDLEAIKVSYQIPVFIFNSEDDKKSFAIPLLENPFYKETELENKHETGFTTVNVKSKTLGWKITFSGLEVIEKKEVVYFSTAIFKKLCKKIKERKSAIEFLINTLKQHLSQSELENIYRDAFAGLEQKTVIELNGEILDIRNAVFFGVFIEECKNSLNKISFVLWGQNLIPSLPNPKQEKDFSFWDTDVLPHLDLGKLKNIVSTLLKEEGPTLRVKYLFEHLLGKEWVINSKEELDEARIFLKTFKNAFPEKRIPEESFHSNSNELYILLFDTGILEDLSNERIQSHITSLKSNDEKAGFIERLPAETILECYAANPDLSLYKERYIAKILDAEFFRIDYLCFDLESDGNKINEYAWRSKSETKSDSDFDKFQQGISELVNKINSNSLLVGQNIKEFDLPILADQGANINHDLIWDTLEIEMLLNPHRISYGLKTMHNASADVNLTLQLFKNQISRLIASGDHKSLLDVLPAKAIEVINTISNNPKWKFLDYRFFENQSNEFFRPNPTNQSISEQTFAKLKEKLAEDGRKVLIAPDFLWDTLSHQFDISFSSDSKAFGFCLSKEKINSILADSKILKTILLRFVDSCQLKGVTPFYQHVPMAVRLKLTPEQATSICDYIEPDFENPSNKPICIKPTDTDTLKILAKSKTSFKVIIIGNELFNLTSKLQLGQDLHFPVIFEKLKNEPVWLQLSGGKSFVSLNQRHCKLFGINDFPDHLQNIWLEKIGKGRFKIWCNLNFEAYIKDLTVAEVVYIDWIDVSATKNNAYIVRPDSKKSGYIAEQKRVNPESLYRRNYWIYQFKLFNGIDNTGRPKILIVNDELEVEKLLAYTRSTGYFIPDTNASLARQLELLHSNKSIKKLLITSFNSLDKIISNNYLGSLDFIWDSFLLQEKLQMMKGKLDQGVEEDENKKEDDYQNDVNTVQKDYDLFSLIKLHKPLIDFYYKMLIDNHNDSQLFICDSRLTDFFGIEKSLNLKAKSIQMWHREKEYEAERDAATEYFPSIHQNAATEFNVEEAKEILRHIFLVPEEGGEPHPWHSYQHPCLNEILPAKKDLLISLPTGAGKSLLFQGPALFRSAFSCKLSIVISPLRALMQDQVDALWHKGFYSNVEFLSGDKSQAEIRDIYRRVAGGEIALLYITPERFRSRSFENCLLTRLDADSGLEYAVFDEAHCISQWGQEFRPDYLNAGRKVAGYSEGFPIKKLLFSATISDQVFEEISLLMPGIATIDGGDKTYNPVRDHIKMDFKHNVVDEERLIEIANYLKTGGFNPNLSRAIVFVKSRRKVEECALLMPDILKEVFGTTCSFSEKVGGFHAGMDAEDRKDTYEKYKSGDIVLLFATKAFGMGMDIPNIHFVTHYSPPSTFEDFLQEVGRAGRNDKQRSAAGFNNTTKPIKTICLTNSSDFANLKDQLHESRISWHEIKDVKVVLEKYISRFKPLIPDNDIPVAVPFTLYSTEKGATDEDLDNKFRIALHWLERLERIKLGYFTITHLEFDSASIQKLSGRIKDCPDQDSENVCHAILDSVAGKNYSDSEVVQISIASLRNLSKLSIENLYVALLKLHRIGLFKLIQEVVIEPTKIRSEEINYCKGLYRPNEKYPALRVVFTLAHKILNSVPANSSKFFAGEELDDFIKESINEHIQFSILPWSKKDQPATQAKEYDSYRKDILKKRSKHAFTIIRLLGKTKHESKMEKIANSNRKVRVVQSLFNGYHKKEEWSAKLKQLEIDCVKLLDYVANNFFDKNKKKFNWPDIITELNLKGNVQYLSDLLFALSILGYCKTGGLLPSGIEVYLSSIQQIDETDLQSIDKKVFDEFELTRKVRELKLIALEVLAGFQKGINGNDHELIRKKQDAFIKRYFACNSLDSLLKLLQDELPANDPLLTKWRGDAIKFEEDRLNIEQRKVYDAEINQHIDVMAGPGSGKTHTLTLRVARLVHHVGTPPEEILVLAYNRAVVSELKERLGKLFSDLGYGNLAKRIKIFTFHGLAKKYCGDDLIDQAFDEWENTLLHQLNSKPGKIMNHLAPLKHILVDEFQDINNVRINLLNRMHDLTGAHLFIIGDPNQSIYGYERIKEGGNMSPWPYYENFRNIFKPTLFNLFDNRRSFPAILNLASKLLTLPEEHRHLIPRPTRIPDKGFLPNYAQIIDRTKEQIDWWNQIEKLIQEKVEGRPYKQIAILFRTNNEVYRGFQKVKSLNLPNIRIRIQGSLPYEFTRIRECHSVLLFIKSKLGKSIPKDFRISFKTHIDNLIKQNPNWNHFYLKVIHALVIEYLDEQDESSLFDNLLEFIKELTQRDDGQLYKIYQKHIDKVSTTIQETEIVLTTMHKVKGLEFDCVIVPPSFSNLPLKQDELIDTEELKQQLDEEKRLAFVAYTRARFRLLVFRHLREAALSSNNRYTIPENASTSLGIPVQPEIKKLKIGWAAKSFNFKGGVNSYINTSVKSGDFVFVKKRLVPYNGSHFEVHEIFKENSTKPIGELASNANIVRNHQSVTGYVVSEVVVWSYEDTCKFDNENDTNFAKEWCQEAKDQGYIYLVDFAGFGKAQD